MATRVSSEHTYPTNFLPVGNAVLEKDGCLTPILFKLLFPLSHSKKEQAQLKKEEAHCKAYWMNTTPLTTVYIGHAGVKTLFHSPMRYTCTVFPEIDKKLTVQYCVIESHHKKEKNSYVNLSYLSGMLTTASSTVAALHPYFSSYHILHEKEKEVPGLRIISWSVNDIFTEDGRQYLPSFQRAGEITYYMHLYLQHLYGKVSWHGHSLGGAFLAEALPHFATSSIADSEPPSICVDRTFTSLKSASYNDLGAYLYKPISSLASRLGIKCDVVACVKLFSKDNQKSKLMLISAIRDHRFHDWPNLCNDTTLRDLAKNKHLTLLGFDPPNQLLTHENSGHSEPINHLFEEHCEIAIGPDCLQKGENLADKLLDLVFEKKERKSR